MHLSHTSPMKTMSKIKNPPFWKFSFFIWISGCRYGYCDRFCDWSIKSSGLSVIDSGGVQFGLKS